MRILALIVAVTVVAGAQEPPGFKGIHQLESELHQNDPTPRANFPPEVHKTRALEIRTVTLDRKVLGWHPYWASATAYLSYDYGALSHIAHFSYETDTATGGYKTIRGWETTPIIDYAHARGVKVILTVTNFGYDHNDKLLSDTVRQNVMINTLITLLKARNGDGVNFDLEQVRNTQRSNLVSFMQRAASRIKAQLPQAEISMATPAVDWSGSWDFAQLAQICDQLIVMGYAYYYSGSTTAGPVAPLEGESYNVTRSVDTHLAAGVPKEKLLLGVPWYGYDWPVQSNARKSPSTAGGSSRTYVVAEPMAATYGKVFDATTKVPWFPYLSGTQWRQVWYDDSTSLALKYGLVNSRQIGGIGIWALSYEGGKNEIWGGIRKAFTLSGVSHVDDQLPVDFVLEQNYPNPFNAETVMEYKVSGNGYRVLGTEGTATNTQTLIPNTPSPSANISFTSRVSLRIYDLLGRQVAVLVDEEKEPGIHKALWNAAGMPSGVYYSTLEVTNAASDKRIASRKIVLIR